MFLFKKNSFILTGRAPLKKKILKTVNRSGTRYFASKQAGEQDDKYYRSLGKLAYRNMGLGGGASIFIYIYVSVYVCLP